MPASSLEMTSERVYRITLAALNGLVGLTASGGGVAILIGADRFPIEWLDGSPFQSYVVPALILALVVGGSALAAAAAAIIGARTGALASFVAGAILMGWIAGEVVILKQPDAPTWIECLYFIAGAVIAALALLLQRRLRSAEATESPTA
ncbi:MAG: hypothetical protein QM765_28940 [Myxococcales bacterium]